MSYLDHIRSCNDFSINGYVQFVIDGELVGWAKDIFVEKLKEYDSVFNFKPNEFGFVDNLYSPESRTEAIKPIIEKLYQQNIINSWVGESYIISNTFGKKSHFQMERAAVAYFGVRSYGVHINGLVKKAEGTYIWIARRTKNKPFWPGKLDQMVAGGQPAGIGLMENVIKESAEEANVPRELAEKAKLVSELHYLGKNTLKNSPQNPVNDLLGMNSDTLFNYDLWLPEDFIPENTDGEVDEFILMSLEEMAELTDTKEEFKNNCNLVNIDLLIRQGFINESHCDYEQIKQELYAPAKLK